MVGARFSKRSQVDFDVGVTIEYEHVAAIAHCKRGENGTSSAEKFFLAMKRQFEVEFTNGGEVIRRSFQPDSPPQ